MDMGTQKIYILIHIILRRSIMTPDYLGDVL